MARVEVRAGMPSVALDKAEFARSRRHDRDTGQLVSGARGLKAMIDRLVCADGGNPGPTSTGGKDAENAARALVEAVKLMRRGKSVQADARLHDVRPK